MEKVHTKLCLQAIVDHDSRGVMIVIVRARIRIAPGPDSHVATLGLRQRGETSHWHTTKDLRFSLVSLCESVLNVTDRRVAITQGRVVFSFS